MRAKMLDLLSLTLQNCLVRSTQCIPVIVSVILKGNITTTTTYNSTLQRAMDNILNDIKII